MSPPRRPTAAGLGLAAALAVGAGLGVGAGCQVARRDPAEALAQRLAGKPQARRLSCESRSAADLLAVHGIEVGEDAVFRLLPRSDNPDLGFVGDVDGPPGRLPPEGYGVHAGPIAAALRAHGLDARVEEERDLAWLAAETAAGRPVIAWVTGGCAASSAVHRVDRAGVPYVAVRGEHTVLVLAVRGASVVTLDPAAGQRMTYDRDEFDAAWALLGRRAVSATGRTGRPPPR